MLYAAALGDITALPCLLLHGMYLRCLAGWRGALGMAYARAATRRRRSMLRRTTCSVTAAARAARTCMPHHARIFLWRDTATNGAAGDGIVANVLLRMATRARRHFRHGARRTGARGISACHLPFR